MLGEKVGFVDFAGAFLLDVGQKYYNRCNNYYFNSYAYIIANFRFESN